MKVRTYYFADYDPPGKALDERLLAFGYISPDGLQVFQCRERGVFPEDTVMIAFEEGDAVRGGDGNLHRAVLCRLCLEDDLDSFVWDEMPGCYVVNMPEELLGVETHVVEHFDDDALDLLRLSVNMARAADGDSDTGEEGGAGSLWRRLGERSRRLF